MTDTSRAASRVDKSTFSNTTAFSFKHLVLDVDVDFEAKVLACSAAWTITVNDAAARELVLDTSGGLVVSEASVNGAKIEFTCKPPHAALGTALVLPLPAAVCGEVGRELSVKLKYTTSPEAHALQWLPPAQTAGKERPFMFSQCQAIHARSLLPCADAPTAKFTYAATVKVPAWATALMSAVSLGAKAATGETKTFAFEQTVPVPSYLVAIVVGELVRANAKTRAVRAVRACR